MRNFIKCKLPFIIVLAVSLLFTAFAVIFSVDQTVPATYYKTGDYENRNYYSALAYQVEIPENHALDSIWINIGSTDNTATEVDGEIKYEEFVEILVGRAKKTDADFGNRTDATQDKVNASFKVENTAEGVKVGRWQKLYDYNTPTKADETYYIIATLNAIEINELAFVGVEKDGTDGGYKGEKVLLNATALGSGVKGIKNPPTASAGEHWYKSLQHNSNIMDMTEVGIANASKLLDEQSAFKPEKIVDGVYVEEKIFSTKELTFARSVNEIYSLEATTIDATENPLGMILVSLSTMLFGTTTFTLRLVPMLFAIVSIILSFFIAKKFIENKYICAGVSSAVALGNLFIVITTAFTFAIGIFFILLSIYFILGYALFEKIKSNKFITYLMLGGLSYGLSLGVKTVFIFALPVLLAIIGYAIYSRFVKTVKASKDGNSRIARINMTREIASAVIAFVVIPALVLSLSFLAVAPALCNAYGANGLFSVSIKHFFGIF